MSTTVVNVGEAKTHFSRLLAMAESGDTVIIARDGVPAVRLTPIQKPRRRFGFWQLAIDDSAFFDPLPDDETALWESDPGEGRGA
jgi:prevent-host-death family protein